MSGNSLCDSAISDPKYESLSIQSQVIADVCLSALQSAESEFSTKQIQRQEISPRADRPRSLSPRVLEELSPQVPGSCSQLCSLQCSPESAIGRNAVNAFSETPSQETQLEAAEGSEINTEWKKDNADQEESPMPHTSKVQKNVSPNPLELPEAVRRQFESGIVDQQREEKLRKAGLKSNTTQTGALCALLQKTVAKNPMSQQSVPVTQPSQLKTFTEIRVADAWPLAQAGRDLWISWDGIEHAILTVHRLQKGNTYTIGRGLLRLRHPALETYERMLNIQPTAWWFVAECKEQQNIL